MNKKIIKEEHVCDYGMKDYFKKEYEREENNMEPANERQIELCRDYIKHMMKPAKSKSYSSYFLKHIVEDHFKSYITNGALIVAAIWEGLEVERTRLSPNVNVKADFLSKKQLENYYKK